MISKEQFKDLFEAHFDAIRNYVFFRCGNMDTASDIAQDVFLRVWEKRSSLMHDYLKPLLYKIASDTYISTFRREEYCINYLQSINENDNAAASPEDEAIYREAAAAYTSSLAKMPEARRVIFLMSREEGMKYKEIAERLGISIKTVEKHVSAALRALRTELNYNNKQYEQ
jgi:RNA polymerase sigma-70 factor (ECF subfamily)